MFKTLFHRGTAITFVLYANIRSAAAQSPATDFAARPFLLTLTATYMDMTADGGRTLQKAQP